MAAGPKTPTRLRFTEEMKGYVAFGETDFDRGFRKGREEDNFLMFHLTIEVDVETGSSATPGARRRRRGT